MSEANANNDPDELVFEEIRESGVLVKRLGRCKSTGTIVL